MKIKKAKYPIKLLEDLEETVRTIRLEAKESSLVEEVEPEEIKQEESEEKEGEEEKKERERNYEIVRFEFNNYDFDFIFTIDDFELEYINGEYQPRYYFYKVPRNENSINHETTWRNSDDLLTEFKHWLGLLARYDALKFIDPITQQYEKEIFDNFKIVDEDADENSFNTEQQIVLIKYLENSKKYLESKQNDYEVIEIITEINNLKRSVTSIPKNQTMRRLATILAKSKKKGMELFKELLTMFKKDIMKKVLTEGYEYVDTLVKLLQGM